MPNRQEMLEFYARQMQSAGEITAKKMFGEAALYCDGNVVAFVCDDRLLMKPLPGLDPFTAGLATAEAYPGSKPYWLVSPERCQDEDWLGAFAAAISKAAPPKKEKKPKGERMPAKARVRSARSSTRASR